MGFAWHKLIPRHPSVPSVCPPPCVDTATWTETLEYTCGPIDPTAGTIICVVTDYDWTYSGSQCGGKEVIVGSNRTNPGAPLELRLNTPLGCYSANNETVQGGAGGIGSGLGKCEMGSYPPRQFYYYRTPNSPSTEPLQITSGKLCLKFNTYSIPDRLMVVSGRNRYKYGGWDVDPDCSAYVPAFWDVPGGTGVKQAETALSRSWPAANSVLNLPLFGANTSQNPSVTLPSCSDGACSQSDCFGVRSNTGTGHYGPSNLGNGKGYYSFQCFNPQSYVDAKPAPACSVWSLVQSIWYQAWQLDQDETSFRNNYSTVATAFDNLLNSDPSGTVTDKSNVRHHLETFAGELTSLGINFIIPNVFLWDKDAYVAASTNPDKWKHIYIVGNANVLFDTQCMVGLGNPVDPNRYGFTIYLDEVSHDPEYGSTGNARLLQFFGCDPTQSNPSSEAWTEIKTMNCVNGTNPKTGQNLTDCDVCYNEGDVNLVQNDCVYFGLSPLCSYSWENDPPP